MQIKDIYNKNKIRKLKHTNYQKTFTVIAMPFTWIAIKLGLTPNMVSILGILSVLFASFQFSQGHNLIAVIILYFGLICDYVDGIVARCTGQVTKYQSVYLERIYHEFVYAFVFLGIGFQFHILGSVLGIICVISILSTSYLFHLKNWILSSFAKQDVREDNFNVVGMNSNVSFLFEIAAVPTRYIKFILLVGVILNALSGFLILYTIYLLLRVPAYFILNYKTLGVFEKCKQ